MEPTEASLDTVYPDDLAAALQDLRKELGYNTIRTPKRSKTVLVLACSPPARTASGIWLPESVRDFFSGLAPGRPVVEALVLACGEGSPLQPGQWIQFSRLFFGWLHKLRSPEGSHRFLGFLKEEHVAGYGPRPDMSSFDGWPSYPPKAA